MFALVARGSARPSEPAGRASLQRGTASALGETFDTVRERNGCVPAFARALELRLCWRSGTRAATFVALPRALCAAAFSLDEPAARGRSAVRQQKKQGTICETSPPQEEQKEDQRKAKRKESTCVRIAQRLEPALQGPVAELRQKARPGRGLLGCSVRA